MKFNLLFVDIFEFYDKKICLSFSSGIYILFLVFIFHIYALQIHMSGICYISFLSACL